MAARSYYAEVRWTLIATGLEALIHTEKYKSGDQFRSRTVKLAHSVGITSFTRDAAVSFYDLRSQLSHGHGLESLARNDQELYKSGEDLIRAILIRSIRDKAFAATFSDNSSIVQNWGK